MPMLPINGFHGDQQLALRKLRRIVDEHFCTRATKAYLREPECAPV